MIVVGDPQLNPVVFTLRPLDTSDEDFSYQVYASTRAGEMQLIDWTPEQKTAFLRMQFTAQRQHYHLHYPRALWQVIERDGCRIGRLVSDNTGANVFLLIDIALLPEYRAQGTGTAVLQVLLRAADRAHKTVSLHVEPNNPARNLYQRLGFVVCAQNGFYFEMKRQPGQNTNG